MIGRYLVKAKITKFPLIPERPIVQMAGRNASKSYTAAGHSRPPSIQTFLFRRFKQ